MSADGAMIRRALRIATIAATWAIEGRLVREVIGYMTEAYALRRYNQELERRRNAELGQRDLFSISEPGSTTP